MLCGDPSRSIVMAPPVSTAEPAVVPSRSPASSLSPGTRSPAT